AAEESPSEGQPEDAPIAARDVESEVLCLCQLELLMTSGQRRPRVVELGDGEAGRQADLAAQASWAPDGNRDPALPPGRRDDAGFDLIPFHAEECRRLVGQVQEAER